MKKYLLSFLTLFGCIVFIHAQDTELDSLLKVLKTAPDDTNKLKLLDYLADNTPDGEWQKHSEALGVLAKQLMSSPYSAVQLEAKRYYSISLNNYAYGLAEQGDYKNALDVYAKCEKIYNEIGDRYNIGLVINSTGAIYERQGDLENAVIKYRETIAHEMKAGNAKDLVSALNNLGVVFAKQNQIDSALYYDYQGLALVVKNNIRNNTVGILLSNIGNNLEKKGNLTDALSNYKKGIQISMEVGDRLGEAYNRRGIAGVYLQQSEIAKALADGEKALKISIDLGNPNSIYKSAEVLKRIYEKQNRYKEAYEMYKMEILNHDSITGKENQRAVIRHQFQYEYDLKTATAKAEQEKKDGIANAELKRQKFQKTAFMTGLFLVALFSVILFNRFRLIRKQNVIIEIEKQKSEELLLNILPEEVAEELKQKGSAEAKLFENVTVLFTDFKNFTGISEKLSAHDLVSELHECFSAFDNIMHKYGIEKIKSMGDSYMAVSGLPTSNPNHAEEMVKAAIEIREFMLNRKKMNPETFDARIGIHSGHVVAGIVGVKKFAYDIWGDTVNTAARMEQNSEAGKINISETTYDLVKDKFTCEYRGEIEAKNKGKLKMYFVS